MSNEARTIRSNGRFDSLAELSELPGWITVEGIDEDEVSVQFWALDEGLDRQVEQAYELTDQQAITLARLLVEAVTGNE